MPVRNLPKKSSPAAKKTAKPIAKSAAVKNGSASVRSGGRLREGAANHAARGEKPQNVVNGV